MSKVQLKVKKEGNNSVNVCDIVICCISRLESIKSLCVYFWTLIWTFRSVLQMKSHRGICFLVEMKDTRQHTHCQHTHTQTHTGTLTHIAEESDVTLKNLQYN